jgi:hypothetical protein
MVDGVNTLKTIVVSLFVVSIIIGGMFFYITDITQHDAYNIAIDDGDNITAAMEFMRDTKNKTIGISEDAAKNLVVNSSQSNVDAVAGMAQGGVAATRYTIKSFDITRELLARALMLFPWIPSWTYSVIIGLLVFIISIALLQILLQLKK